MTISPRPTTRPSAVALEPPSRLASRLCHQLDAYRRQVDRILDTARPDAPF